jgi:hypothetical protein
MRYKARIDAVKRALAIGGLLTAALLTTEARADLAYSGYAVSGVNAHITYQGTTIYAGDGLITLQTSSAGGVPAWCVDVADWLAGSGEFAASPAVAPWSAEVAALVYAASPNATPQQNAATQTAIWLTALPGIEVSPDDPTVLPLAEALLAEPLSPGGPLDVLSQPGNQTLVTAMPVSEPSSLAAMLSGLAGLMVVGGTSAWWRGGAVAATARTYCLMTDVGGRVTGALSQPADRHEDVAVVAIRQSAAQLNVIAAELDALAAKIRASLAADVPEQTGTV